MKVFILLALAVVARSTVIRYAPAAAIVETGDSAQFRSEDSLGNYNFGYNEDHTSGGTFRREAGDAYGNVAGSYGLRDADGRLRIVNYVADDDGFRADIKTNEPGVEPKDPSDVTINKGSAIVLETAAPAAIVASAPVAALAVEQVPIVSKSAHVFPAPLAAPVAKTSTTTVEVAHAAPAVVAAAPLVSKSAHLFPAPLAAPVAKTHTTTVEVAQEPIAVAAPAPLVSKSAHVFPAPLAAPVAKTHTTIVQVAQEPITIAEPAPLAVKSAYTFPPVSAAVPVPKSAALVQAPVPVVVQEPAPVAVKSAVAFPPPAAVPVAKSVPVAPVASAPAVAVARAAPLTYTSHVAVPIADPENVGAPAKYAAVNVGAPALTYAAPLSFAGAPVAPLTLSGPFTVNHVALGAPAHYSHSYIGPRTLAVKSSGIHYAGALSPYYYGHPSPALSIVGASAYLNPYYFNGVRYVKK